MGSNTIEIEESIMDTSSTITPTQQLSENEFECSIDAQNKTLSVLKNDKIINDLEALKIKYNVVKDDEGNDKIIITGSNYIDYVGFTLLKQKPNESIKIIGEPLVNFMVWKSDPDAVEPSKTRFSDVGFDLTIIKKIKEEGNCVFFDTGIKVQVPIGFYVQIVPRSSLSKTGWMLANSVGIIDNGYTGNIIVALTKVDPNAADLELPFRAVQMILQKQFFSYMIEGPKSVPETSREAGGFGSTDIVADTEVNPE
jgi:dUTP pyrophosphatase